MMGRFFVTIALKVGVNMKDYKKLLFVINPNAGMQRKEIPMVQIISLFEDYGYVTMLCYTRKAGDAKNIVERYADEGIDLIVCMGGDGTLNETFAGARSIGWDGPIGYIPAGSTNDFASSLGLPADSLEAAKYIMKGEAKYLDLGLFNGRVFVYTASTGIFTKTSYETPQKVKNRLGHLAYLLEGVKDLNSVHPIHMTIKTDKGVFEDSYIFVAICNTSSLGGVMNLDEADVDLNDGVFELITIANPRDLVQLNLIIKALREQDYDEDSSLVQLNKIRTADIEFKAADDWSLDGEKGIGNERIHFEIIHNAVRLIY